MKRLALGFLAISILLLAIPAEMAAQSRTGTILGTVADPTGAVLPGATVTITNLGTNQSREVVTDASGRYVVTLLPVGRYAVKVKASGFADGVASDLVLEVQDNRTVDFTLSPAAVGEVIEVTADVLAVDTTTATLGQVIHEEQVTDLPLNGRNFVQLGWLAPGVTKGEGTFLNNRGNTEVSIRGSVSLSVQGMRENTNDWLLDGVDNNELTAGAISILPSVDGIQEFKVLTFNYSAEYGSRSSSTILVVTKGGSNEFHGTAFEFFRNDQLDARNFFDRIPKPAKLRQNQFGASVGGPILKDQLFFFGNYEGTRTRQGLTGFATVPSDAMHSGDFSEGFNGPIFDPCPTFDIATRTCPGGFLAPAARPQFAGNMIPANRIDPIGLALIDLYPSPNAPSQFSNRLSNNFASNPVRTFNDDQFAFRIDYRLSEKDQIFGRFNYDDADQFFPTFCRDFCSSTSVAASSEDFITEARNLAVQWQRSFSPTLINQLMAGYNRVFNTMNSFAHRPENQNLPAQLGIPGANLGDFETSGMTNIGISGLNRLGSRLFTPFLGGTNVFHFADNVMVVKGAHTLKMGFTARLMQMPVIGNTWFHGNFNFDASYTRGATGGTGSAIADLLLGFPRSAARNDHFQGFLNGRRWEEYRAYFEDSWKATPSLTLTLGLAYNVTTPQREDNDRFTNFDPSTGEYLVAGVNANRAAGVETDWNNLEPRLGLAWTPWGSKTVIRAGYGIFTDVSANGGVQGLYMNPPFAAALGLFTNGITPVDQVTGVPVTLADGFPIQSPPDLATYTGALVLTELNFEQGFIQQWNLNVEHELPGGIVATVAYAGTRATQLQTKGSNLNAGLPGPVPDPSTRPFPTLGTFNAILARGELSYHALILRAEKRFSQGLFFLANYTWSKALSNGPGQNIGVNQGTRYFPLPQSLVGDNADKASSDTDLRHQFSLSYLYDLPIGRNRPFLSDLSGVAEGFLGGWQISGITRIRSGFPLALTTGFFDSANAGVGNRPDRICDGAGPKTVQQWFDTSCFPLVFGRLGNSARSVLSGPRQVNFDFSILKTIPLREPMRLEFRTEFFNIFNHAQFDVPDTNSSSGTFGTISSTINTSRQIQFALKFIF
ncbi:MAG: carboxypeptidase-like regulatory domain-containing protein [Gemmataceae bacterium]|nr:carboxypeptidase-like regulatory domain-containing protein [Gemmataceae bacterium]